MADLFIELVSEDIPARMQAKACGDLQRLVYAALDELGLEYAKADDDDPRLVSSRHLAVYVADVDERQADRMIEKRGPRVDAPEQAINGFLASTGLTREQLVEEDTPKGRFLFARSETKGAQTSDLLAPVIIDILQNFPWPKSQRWGTSRFRWVRPLHRINVLFGGKLLDGALALGGDDDAKIIFGDKSCGHFFESPEDIDLAGLKNAQDYIARMKNAHVLVDHNERAKMVWDQATHLAADMGCSVKTGLAQVNETANLVEWPHLLVGKIEDRFMQLPAEVLQSSIQTHQKYITLAHNSDQSMSPHFIIVANRVADPVRDDIIKAGNQRVLRARLADAEFFWMQDKAKKLEEYLPQLADITFYAGLGSVLDKAHRIEKLAGDIAPFITSCDQAKAQRAGLLAKADLVTGMVGEFPELQGIIGSYYAVASGEDGDVAEAVQMHYQYDFDQADAGIPPVACAVMLADKIDTLVGFFGVNAKPTGSKDPYALRRAALGIIGILGDETMQIRMPLTAVLEKAAGYHGFSAVDEDLLPFIRERLRVDRKSKNEDTTIGNLTDDERFAEAKRNRAFRSSVVDAALADDDGDDIYLMTVCDRELQIFINTPDGKNLLAASKRVNGILEAEEKKTNDVIQPEVKADLFNETEQKLYKAVLDVPSNASSPIEVQQQYEAFGKLRSPIDDFFTEVVVNDSDPSIRTNRLGLLALIRSHMQKVADFSKIEG